MIYTITFNPSLDYIVKVGQFQQGEVNRAEKEEIYPGGKGINVSVVLSNLGIKNKALGFTAGFTGENIEKWCKKLGCSTNFIPLENGFSRINVKIKAQKESEINGQGPEIPKEAILKLFSALDALKDGDTLVMAGSIPNTLPEDMYEKIMDYLKGKKIRFVVDATGKLLINVLKYHPFLIKPNHHELEEIFGIKIKTEEDSIQYGKKLQEMGAKNVLISMAEKGALFLSETGEIFSSLPPKGTLINSVGAGDSMVAGFLAGYLKTNDYHKAFLLGLAAGSATAFSPWLCSKKEVEKLLDTPEKYGL